MLPRPRMPMASECVLGCPTKNESLLVAVVTGLGQHPKISPKHMFQKIASNKNRPNSSKTSWWLNQPLWKNMLVKLDHLPRDRGKKSKDNWNHHLETIQKSPCLFPQFETKFFIFIKLFLCPKGRRGSQNGNFDAGTLQYNQIWYTHLSNEKNSLTFQYTGCWRGILTMACHNPHMRG